MFLFMRAVAKLMSKNPFAGARLHLRPACTTWPTAWLSGGVTDRDGTRTDCVYACFPCMEAEYTCIHY